MPLNRMIAASAALGLLCLVTGCPKKKPPAPSDPAPNNAGLGGSLGRAPAGGSQTLPGKIRDRAVDSQIMNEMRQVKVALDADYPDGKGPANAAAWKALLRDFRHLRVMLEQGEIVTNNGVDTRRQAPNTVLLYEKRAAEGDGIVLFCDGSARRITSREEFAGLPQPKP